MNNFSHFGTLSNLELSAKHQEKSKNLSDHELGAKGREKSKKFGAKNKLYPTMNKGHCAKKIRGENKFYPHANIKQA